MKHEQNVLYLVNWFQHKNYYQKIVSNYYSYEPFLNNLLVDSLLWQPISSFISLAGYWWLTPIILAIQEAEIRRIAVWSQSRQIPRDPILKIPNIKKGWWSWSRCRPWVQTPVPTKKKNKKFHQSKKGRQATVLSTCL
jgi:hypothetical protein